MSRRTARHYIRMRSDCFHDNKEIDGSHWHNSPAWSDIRLTDRLPGGIPTSSLSAACVIPMAIRDIQFTLVRMVEGLGKASCQHSLSILGGSYPEENPSLTPCSPAHQDSKC